MNKIWTIIDIVRWGTEFFGKHGIESARLNIELILCDVLKMQRLELYTKYEKPIADNELEVLRDFVKRRAKREPLQYILSKQSFIDLELKLNSNVLIPRPETELLAEKAVSILSEMPDSPTVLDIGTGSGCIAIYIAKHAPHAQVTAIDISADAIESAKQNAELNSVENISFFQTDILQVTPKKKYDLIVSNPPYIAETDYTALEAELFFEPKIALSDFGDGYAFYRRFAEFFGQIMHGHSTFLLELALGQDTTVQEFFSEKGFETEMINDYSNIPRIIYGRKK